MPDARLRLVQLNGRGFWGLGSGHYTTNSRGSQLFSGEMTVMNDSRHDINHLAIDYRPESETFAMDERQLEWVDGRLTKVEETVLAHEKAIGQLVELVPEIKRLIKWSYILLGGAAVLALVTHSSALLQLITGSIH